MFVNNSVCNTTLEQLPSERWNLTFGILIAIVSAVGSLENGVVFWLFCANPSLRTLSNKIIASIVAADFFTGFIVGPLYSAQLLSEKFSSDCIAHKVRRILGIIFMGSSLASILFISIDRSHRITKLQNYKMSSSVLHGLLTLCWLVPLFMALLGLISEGVHSTIVSLVGVIAIIVICTCYAVVIFALKRRRRSHMDKKKEIFMKNERRAGKTVIVILTFYVTMLLPMFIEKGLFAMKVLKANSSERSITHMFTILLFIGNCVVNPIIYCSRIPSIRKHLFILIGLERKASDLIGRSIIKENVQVSESRGDVMLVSYKGKVDTRL